MGVQVQGTVMQKTHKYIEHVHLITMVEYKYNNYCAS